MKTEVFTIGPVETNCYFLTNDETKELVVIDPAIPDERLFQKVKKEGLIPTAFLLTHGHYDHILGLEAWKQAYPDVPVLAGAAEAEVLADPSLNLSGGFREYAVSIKPERLLEDGETFSFLGETFKFLLTPGHTEGSGCFYLEERALLFCGDTLFHGSMGRCDLPTGSEITIIGSLKKLMELPVETMVYPGHGDETTIGFEKQYNPFCRW